VIKNDENEAMNCGHRTCAIRKLLVFIKIVSGRHAELDIPEDKLLDIGLKALKALGVTPEEILMETLDLAIESGLRTADHH
jgi:hypothetical protein